MKWHWLTYGLMFSAIFAMGTVIGWYTAPASVAIRNPDRSTATDWSNPLQPAYVGDKACAECHAEQFALHAKSGHGRTLHSENLSELYPMLKDREVPDPIRDGVLKFKAEGSQLFSDFDDGRRRERLPIQFAFGSGTHATTFVTLLDDNSGEPTLLEHRLSLFFKGEKLGLTPSHSELSDQKPLDCLGRTHRGHDATTCVGCHATTARIRGSEVDDLRGNVGCESCHGPGRTHAAALRAHREDDSMRFSKGFSSPMQEIRMCGKCHRLPEMMSTRPSQNDAKLARFQPIGLLNSNCFRRAKERMRCSTCHNPHETVDLVSENYTEKCRNCHSTPDDGHKVCPKSPSEKCVDCHMPAVEVHPGISFHDHWIRVRAGAATDSE